MRNSKRHSIDKTKCVNTKKTIPFQFFITMKKNLFRKFLALFLTGTLLAGVGCKDYDDDIDKLNDRLDELTTGKIATLESQLGSLQTAVDNLKSADDALGKRIDELKSDADANAKDIEALEKAQDQLQKDIDAIEKDLADNYVTKSYLNTTLSSYATTKYVGDAVAAVTNNLGKFTTEKAIQDAINAAKDAAIAAAGDACKDAFQTSFNAAVASANLVNETKLTQAINDYDTKIKQYLEDAITKEDGFINKAIAEAVSDAVADLQAMISGRLTSVLLIPDLYVNGIETIELKSLSYEAWKVTSSASAETVTQGSTTSTTAASATSVRYNVSPSVVTKEDIKDPSFVFEKAEVRTRAAVSEQLLNVASWDIAGGVLTVDVKKTAGTALTLDAKHIYTAALKVPLADKYLGEGEVGTAVYSDYVALTETAIEPKIAALIDLNSAKSEDGEFECDEAADHYHFSADYEAAQAADPSFTEAYNKPIDLLSMVTGCYIDDDEAKEITKEALKAAGLEFRFVLPTKPYKVGDNDTDQQKFASVANTDGAWTLTSKLPDGTTNNQAAIDKTPIVRVELVDVNNKNAVVDVRYFKVQWLKEKIAPVDLKVLKTFDYTLTCDAFKGSFTWEEMVTKVLGKLGENGLSQAEFIATYAAPEIAATDHNVGTVAQAAADGVELLYNFDATAAESAAAFTWTLTTEQIGNVIADLINGKEVKKVVNVTIPAQNVYQGKLTFSFVVNIKMPTLPEIYGYDSSFWHSDYDLAYVYPIQFNTPGAYSTCAYRYELDRLFADSKPVTNLLPCGKWDIQFAKTQPATGYAPALTTEPAGEADKTGYTLKKGAMDAVKLNYNGMGDNWYAPATTNPGAVNTAAAADITVQVLNNEAGIGILKQQATLKVWAAINPYNHIELTDFNVYFVEPLKINTELTDAYFVDQIISGSEVDCSKAFTMTDFKDYIVAEVTTGTDEKEKYASDLYAYYAVNAPAWDLANAKTNLKKDASGNYVVDGTITAQTATIKAEDRFGVNCITKDGSKLVFKNINGVKVEKTVKLFIPVTVSHKWGTMTANVTIELHPEEPAN